MCNYIHTSWLLWPCTCIITYLQVQTPYAGYSDTAATLKSRYVHIYMYYTVKIISDPMWTSMLKAKAIAVFLPKLKAKRGEGFVMTTTSKGLMHSNDHIKEKWATIEGLYYRKFSQTWTICCQSRGCMELASFPAFTCHVHCYSYSDQSARKAR